MRRIKLTRQEKAMEDALARGEYVKAADEEFQRISKILAARKKDAILHIRINNQDLSKIKAKARELGVKYQTFVSEILHHAAM